MNLFLKIKAWQLFCLIMHPIFVIMIWVIVIEQPGKLIYIPLPLWVSSLGIMLIWGIWLCWLWTLGTRLNKKIPERIRMKSKFFRFGIIYSMIYFLCSSICGGLSVKIIGIVIPIFLFGSSFAMVCILYACYFISINFVRVEKKQKKGSWECIKLFMFLVWFWPGIWYLQPKINKIFKEETGV